jgi:hypothetical protein
VRASVLECGQSSAAFCPRRCTTAAALHRGLLTVARDFGWHLEAWAVFSK